MKRSQNFYNYYKRTQLKTLTEALLQGKTFEEAGAEFGYSACWVKKKFAFIKQDYPEKASLIKNKPYMAFQRIIYTDCSLEEALKVFKVSEKTFWNFMKKALKINPHAYIKVRSKIHNKTIADKECQK